MKKCPKCSQEMHKQFAICSKCGMPMLVEGVNNCFWSPSGYLSLLKQQKKDAIKDTKPIPLPEQNELTSVAIDDVYIDTVWPQEETKKVKNENENLQSVRPTKETKKTAYKTISIPLLKDKKTDKMRIPPKEVDLDEESEELIISDLEDNDEAEDLGYEPEIVGFEEHIPKDSKKENHDLDIDLEYMPLPGEKEVGLDIKTANVENNISKKENQPKAKDTEAKDTKQRDTTRISKLKQEKLNVEYIPEYPDAWEWVIFDNDTENKLGYQISGREKEKSHFSFLIFPDDNISEDVISKISSVQKEELKSLLEQGKIMESIRNLRKNFKALPFRQAERIIKKFANQEKFKVQNLHMPIDLLPAKDRKVIMRILKQGKTLEAIYLFRSITKLDLKQSREQIEYLCEKEKLTYDPMQVTTENLIIKKKKKGLLFILIRLGIIALIIYIIWVLFLQ